MSHMDEREKLAHLLEHWAEHNEGHAKSYEEWAQKARGFGMDELAATLEALVLESLEAARRLRQERGKLD